MCDRPAQGQTRRYTPASWGIVRVIVLFYCPDFFAQIVSSVCVLHGRTMAIIILSSGPMGSVGAL